MRVDALFQKEPACFSYLDPMNSFQLKELHLEVRRDFLHEVTTRVLPYRFRLYERPEISTFLEKSPPEKCPFCLPQRDILTPRFPPDICPEGKFRRGEAVLFPNAFPHSEHNTVALLSDRHFLGLEDITPSLLVDCIRVSLDYMERMAKKDPSIHFASINWNYLSPSGGGLLHPHLQTVMGQKPTRFVDTLIKNAHRYGEEEGRDLWVDYLAWEKGEERYIGSSQGWEWLVSFAPRGMAGEIAFFFPERHSLFTLNDDIINGLCAGLCRVLSYLNGINLISFNLALYGTMGEDRRLPLQGRLIPRYLIPPLGASDVNYFEKCHGEIICPFVPEDLARGLKEAFFNLSTEGD